MVEPEVLGRPHLVLADVGGENRLAVGRLGDRLDDRVGLRPLRPLFERLVERPVAPGVDPGHPVVVARLLDLGNQQLQHLAASPTTGTSVRTFFPISAGSMST